MDGTSSVSVERRPTRRTWFLLLVGVALLQAAWICSVPPFRAVDEFDHAYRAASVAGGEWGLATEPAVEGRGRLVTVPRALVDAAHDVCEWYSYTGPDNCNPVTDAGADKVRIASSAIGQTPLIYAVLGVPAAPFEGNAALYVMRGIAAAICLALLALALWAMSQWARTPWPYAGLLAALTPMAVFTSIIPAGNGPEIMAGVLLWCALIGLGRVSDIRVERRLLRLALPALALLALLRQAGPAMAFAIVVLVAVLLGGRRVATLWRAHWGILLRGTVMTLALSALQLWWTVAVSRYPVGPLKQSGAALASADGLTADPLIAPLVWWVQALGVFPTRTEPAPLPAYVLLSVVGLGLWVAALLRARRQGLTLLLIAAVTLAFPYAFALWLWDLPQWQGRYGLALGVGGLLVAGSVLDERSSGRRGWALLVAVGVLAAQLVCLVGVRDRVEGEGPLWLVLLLTIGAAVTVTGAFSRGLEESASVQSPAESSEFA